MVIGYFLLEHHFCLLHVDYLWFPLPENQTWHEHRMHFKGNLSRNRLSNTSARFTNYRDQTFIHVLPIDDINLSGLLKDQMLSESLLQGLLRSLQFHT